MKNVRRRPCILTIVLGILVLVQSEGCAFYKGGRPFADVTRFSSIATTPKPSLPLYLPFDFQHYANGSPAAGQAPKRVAKFNDIVIKVFREAGFRPVQEIPTEGRFCPLNVSLKEEERFNSAAAFFSGFTLCLVPFVNEINYELKADLQNEQNELIKSYSLTDSWKALTELFMLFYMPFNKDYPGLITDNLARQLAMQVASDLRQTSIK